MSKKKGFSSVVLVLVLTLIFFIGSFWVFGSHGEAADKWIVATWEPSGVSSAPYKTWLKDLEERTKGRITGEISYASMGPPGGYYDLAAKGLVHVSFVGIPYSPGRFPMQEVMQLPITGEVSSEQMTKAYWLLYKKGYFDQELKDVKVLWTAGQCPYHLQMIKGKDVLKISDLKGKKLRASGDIHTAIVKALGGIPVGMPAPETPIAMQKGVIDGTFQGYSFLSDFRTEQMTGSVTEVGVSSVIFAMVMNKKKYDSLPQDIQQILEKMGLQYSGLAGAGFDEGGRRGEELLKNAGGVVHRLPPAEADEIGRLMAPIWNDWIAAQEAKGRPAKAVIADLYKTFKEMGIKKPFHGYQP